MKALLFQGVFSLLYAGAIFGPMRWFVSFQETETFEAFSSPLKVLVSIIITVLGLTWPWILAWLFSPAIRHLWAIPSGPDERSA